MLLTVIDIKRNLLFPLLDRAKMSAPPEVPTACVKATEPEISEIYKEATQKRPQGMMSLLKLEYGTMGGTWNGNSGRSAHRNIAIFTKLHARYKAKETGIFTQNGTCISQLLTDYFVLPKPEACIQFKYLK